MLFDPGILLREPLLLAGVLAIILVGKSIAAYAIVRLFGRSNSTALTIAASLAQIGEFSFILAALGVQLEILPTLGRDLILAGAILSILVNPLVFYVAERFVAGDAARAKAAAPATPVETVADLIPTTLTAHEVIVGYGRVGNLVARGLQLAGRPFLVIEDRDEAVDTARAAGMEVISGNASDLRTLEAANLPAATTLYVAIPETFEAGQVIEQAKTLNPSLDIVARAHSDAEVAHLRQCGAQTTIMGEAEIARRMLEHRALT